MIATLVAGALGSHQAGGVVSASFGRNQSMAKLSLIVIRHERSEEAERRFELAKPAVDAIAKYRR